MASSAESAAQRGKSKDIEKTRAPAAADLLQRGRSLRHHRKLKEINFRWERRFRKNPKITVYRVPMEWRAFVRRNAPGHGKSVFAGSSVGFYDRCRELFLEDLENGCVARRWSKGYSAEVVSTGDDVVDRVLVKRSGVNLHWCNYERLEEAGVTIAGQRGDDCREAGRQRART